MLCTLILYVSGGTFSIKSIPNARLLRNFSWQAILSEFLPEICWEIMAEEIYFFHTSSWCLIWDTNPSFKSNNEKQYLLEYDDFNSLCHMKYSVRTIWIIYRRRNNVNWSSRLYVSVRIFHVELKSYVYANKPETLVALKSNITYAIAHSNPNLCICSSHWKLNISHTLHLEKRDDHLNGLVLKH